MVTTAYELTPRGPFDLAQQRRFFGWAPFQPDPSALAMCFPVEGWQTAALVVFRQPAADAITGTVHGCVAGVAERAWEQAVAVLSLDIDGADFPAVGDRDPIIARLQRAYAWMRPTLFHSPYEAACNFIIGQRISIAQARALRARMATESGDTISAQGAELSAFPRPQRLLELSEIRGLPEEKVRRLHGVATAAIDGILDRRRLRSLPVDSALAELTELRGVGAFSAQGILHRGAGLVDEVTDDPVTKQAVQRLYELDHLPAQSEVIAAAEPWRPFRTWSQVLLHVWLRGEGGGPAPREGRRRGGAAQA